MKRLVSFLMPIVAIFGMIATPVFAAAPGSNPSELNFDDTEINEGPAPTLTVTIFSSNVAEAIGITSPIEIIDPSTGLVSDNYVIDAEDCTGATLFLLTFLLPGSVPSCSIDVIFDPDVVAVYDHELLIPHNGADPNPFIVPLHGVGYQVTFSPDPIDFGDIFHNRTSTITHTVTNVGPIPLMIDSLSLTTGTEFSIVGLSDTCSGNNIPAGSSCTVDIEFDPSGVGSFTDNLNVDTFGYTANPGTIDFDVDVEGTAIAGAGISLSSTSLDFGNVVEGNSSSTQTVTLTNVGADPLTVSDVTLPPGAPFSITSENCESGSPIPVDGTCTITSQFNPPTPGNFNSTIAIASDAVAGPDTIDLSGVGLPEGEPIVGLNPGTLDFGNVEVNTSDELTLTISNTGQQDLVIGQLGISGINSALFSLNDDNCSNTTLTVQNPDDSCTVDVNFGPVGIGTDFTASLDIPSNASTTPDTVVLIGDGFIQVVNGGCQLQNVAVSFGLPAGWAAMGLALSGLLYFRRRK